MSHSQADSTYDPFRVLGPAAVSFSGGRTSAYMLRRILDAHGGVLPPDVHVIFANTGKEREETLEFVRECGARWNVPITWLEYDREWFASSRVTGAYVLRHKFRVVSFETAARDGEPYVKLIRARRFLPNVVTRFCTTELKIRPMVAWMRSAGYEAWTSAVGLRADEPARVTRIYGRTSETPDQATVCPLATAGVTKSEVLTFWRSQPFDLRLRDWEGNCDICFLKGIEKRRRIMRDRPDLAAWWIDREDEMGARFRAHSPSYAQLLKGVQSQPLLPIIKDEDPTDLQDCACTD